MRLPKNMRYLALAITLSCSAAFGQAIIANYAEGKVFLKNGFTFEGKNLRMTMETVTLEVVGQDQVLKIDDVVQVMAKEGKSLRYGKNCAIVATSLSTLNYLLSGGKYTDEDGVEQKTKPAEWFQGVVLLGGLSYGVGYFSGMSTDHWEVVYLKRN